MDRILGRDACIHGVRHYLDKHDGEAVTIEDFVTALEESSGLDLKRFRRWYDQVGTPRVEVDSAWDGQSGEYRLTLRQAESPPLHIPVAVALIEPNDLSESELLHLDERERTWTFVDLSAEPTPSLLRGFSAPVKLEYPYSRYQLLTLLARDDDPVARWEVAQQLFMQVLIADMAARREGVAPPPADEALIEVVRELLSNSPDDRALLAAMLTLPEEARLEQALEPIDVAAVVTARDRLRRRLAVALADEWGHVLDACGGARAYRFEPEEVGRRRLAALALDYRAALDTPAVRKDALARYRTADNMTVATAALNALRDADAPERAAAFDDFEVRWRDAPLVLDKWFALQAASRLPEPLERMRRLLAHPRYDAANPNRIRAVLGTFARANLPGFHAPDGSGHRLLAEEISTLDRVNPQIAARLATRLAPWRRYAEPQASSMHAQLERLAGSDPSSDLREIVERALKA
jgi:aminopeptidase N